MLFTGELTQRQLAKKLKEKTQEELLEMEKLLMNVLKETGLNERSRTPRSISSERLGSRGFGEQRGELDHYRRILCAIKTELSRRTAEKELGE